MKAPDEQRLVEARSALEQIAAWVDASPAPRSAVLECIGSHAKQALERSKATCPRCGGTGKVSQHSNGAEPWRPELSGQVTPVQCRDCQGTGVAK